MATPYKGNLPAAVNRDAKYSVVYGKNGGMEIRLVYRLNHSELELLTTDQHDDLVKMVNNVKEEVAGMPGGAFYINEYGHVIVPVDRDYYYAGTYSQLLEFAFGDTVITPEAPDGIKPGEDWPGPHVGIPYVLAAGGNDIKYRVHVTPSRIREEKLSVHVGRAAANRLSRRLAQVKGSMGGRVYLNEDREFFAPIPEGENVSYVYLGPLADDPWFPEPVV